MVKDFLIIETTFGGLITWKMNLSCSNAVVSRRVTQWWPAPQNKMFIENLIFAHGEVLPHRESLFLALVNSIHFKNWYFRFIFDLSVNCIYYGLFYIAYIMVYSEHKHTYEMS